MEEYIDAAQVTASVPLVLAPQHFPAESVQEEGIEAIWSTDEAFVTNLVRPHWEARD